MSSPNPLDAHNLLKLIPQLLPRSTSSPLPNPTDSIAILVHAIHTSLRFRLIQSSTTAAGPSGSSSLAQPVGEGATGDDIDDGASETTTAVDAEEADSTPQEGVLNEGWNHRGEDSYTFQYRHEQSSLVFRVRIGRMGNRVQVDAMAEDGQPHNLSIVLSDLVDSSRFPIPSSATSSSTDSPTGGDELAKSWGYKSITSIKEFVGKYKSDVIARLIPGLQVPGYEEFRPTGSDPRNPPPSGPSHQPPSARPQPPTNPLRDPHPTNPASIGRRDLDPLAAFQPPGSFNPNRDGGGMYVDFNHPLFDRRRQGLDPDFSGPGGSIQPPGSRWDPVGPSAGGGRGGGLFPGPGGNPLGGTGEGDDRWGDELPPPGEYGPDLGRFGGPGSRRGVGPGGGPGGFGGLGGLGGGRGGGGGFGGGFGGGGGGGMFM
ncbi:hypothetical protein I302_105703 [Kwoniella bestiolae CBS 10118]|uniref:Uncharacterized protein n=1 Tax=Kwoniella bestiolae CBS 10118 TaxID=1296100 RepID=A0A1B9G1W9_9TREE|nr:hypothetical protein I302_04823 [Kwoniella bestiolae CBS 10118]OCF25013.1 hypothetical protein I302_04823 [Kwoniella bestiolae CBS 10118]